MKKLSFRNALFSGILAAAVFAPGIAQGHAAPHRYIPPPASPIPIVFNATVLHDAGITMSGVYAERDSVHFESTGSVYYSGTRICVNFTNTANVAATAVRFIFIPKDAFGEGDIGQQGDRTGMFSPNALIAGPPMDDYSGNSDSLLNCWKVYAPGAKSFVVAVTKVAYADGNVWTFDPSTTRAPYEFEPEMDLSL